MWFVYIVQCSDNTYYTGISKDVFARVATHNAGKGSKYTRSRLPVRLLWTQQCEDHSTALRLELNIKKLSRKQKEEIVNARPTK